ncbi:hypothetical protein M0208_05255 [Sphingomonas sp. SUN019]|uniref:hypothetical protein n=1 Tax=Sphingomonas sp. SUN019 TaxID=2937788 RepID=UPI002164AF81|nr:hypothetical protein [Sphingomonas sp. SUN019]UVO49956.1 hypothetical protein M0208_05255 [Sphingomonas sp. SUN019]
MRTGSQTMTGVRDPAGRMSVVRPAAVYPSGPTLPERVLRITIVFAQPPEAMTVADALLYDRTGTPIAGAFLQQDLWSPDGQVLTLLLDPARVKSGLIANRDQGFALIPGERVDLAFGGETLKSWTVVVGGCQAPEPARWRIMALRSATRDPLRVALDTRMDFHARNLIAVVDAWGLRVPGTAELTIEETEWRFTPDRLWRRGRYHLRVHPNAETPCGDTIAGGFEQTPDDEVAPASQVDPSFTIR